MAGRRKSFDLTTHVRDTRTGEVIREQAYRAFVSKEFGTLYERPVGSGICYTEDGERAPTIAQVKKNIELMKANEPKVLTTADIDTIKNDFANEYKAQAEAEIKAKAEEEFNARLDDLVAERMTAVLDKLGIGGEQAEAVKEEVSAAPIVATQEPTDQQAVVEEKPDWLKGE
ncbi:MAG: hypothetical protein ACXADS_15100 [Candidatus Thorarchaeota archaeon]